MERWRGRVAVVTGASAGIGAAIAFQLQDAGVTVVALARRSEKIPEALILARKAAESRGRAQIGKASAPGALHCLACDVSKEEDIVSAFTWVKEHLDGVDILVNNAGVAGQTKLSETNTAEWNGIMKTNVLGLSICTREALQQMKARGVEDGHIIHIGSIVGHEQPGTSEWAMTSASKHAVRVLTEGLRKELVAAKSKIKVTEIAPGLSRTDLFNNLPMNHDELWKLNSLFPEDIADAVLYSLSTPPHVQVHCMIVKPSGQTF